MKTENTVLAEGETIQSKIYTIRGVKVMLDRDLAGLYEVTTGNLNLAVRRNIKRFPEDFMFQITHEELKNLILQIARSSWGGIRKRPYAFTELGVSMLSSILRSEVSIEVNIRIMRVFVELRRQISINPHYELLLAKIKQIESKVETIETRQLVGDSVASNKIIQLSADVRHFSTILDEFQNGNIIVKKPNEGPIFG